jgi:tol-pal system protein YbgF
MRVYRFHFERVCRHRPMVLIPLLSLLFAGCVSTTDFDAMKSDLNQIKRENQELKRSLSDTKRVREDSFSAMRESQSSLLSQVNEVSGDLRVLRGRFDENKFTVEKSLKEGAIERDLLRAQIGNLENKVKELQGRIVKGADTGVAPSKTEEGQEKGKEAEQTKEVSPKKAKPNGEGVEDDPVRAYESAYNLFEEKKFKEARESLGSYIKKFPKSSLAGNAQFWIAETYYAEKDHEGAILEYEKLIKMYPGNQKIPGALYKQGLSFMELNDKKTAKVIFQRLIESYPDSKHAEMAKKKVAEIDKKQPPVKKKR